MTELITQAADSSVLHWILLSFSVKSSKILTKMGPFFFVKDVSMNILYFYIPMARKAYESPSFSD